ncbi:MAG: crossover junction endodeoxyribonuclease RuvC [Candidatus Omnitrophica bacterium]|nr:crossover junction endodeoxyribonuclease RuvC [Candidatus Omnitrophota bacterium]
MRILGIDPGLDTIGYGVIDDDREAFDLLEAGVIKTSPKQPIETRLKKIYRGVTELINRYKPKILVLEKLYSHYKHPVTVILMGHGRGVICLAAGEKNIPLVSYPAKRIKKSVTGNGNASKEQVQRMVQGVLGVGQVKVPLDVTDALAAAMTHSYARRAIDK